MKGIDNLNLEITNSNTNNEIQLFDTSKLRGYVQEPYKYNITSSCLVSSLNARVYLPSRVKSDVPNIYPEDSAYARFAKKQSVLQDSVRLQLFTKNFNGTKLNLGIVQLANYGGYFTENILLEVLNTQRESLALGEGVSLWCRCLDGLATNDSINLFGMAVWELSLLAIDPKLTPPDNFGVTVVGNPTLIRPYNPQRYRFHIQNIGSNPCWFVYGSGSNAVVNQCLYLAPGSSWEEETLRWSTSQAVWAICEPGVSTQVVGMEQSVLY
ncbi:hypothetical protein [Vibrio sp.]|uniref:hypothetical protein n=1 Tax=Vibrio sp. TaxID=678 RepID=UPI003D0D4DF3